MRYKIEIKTMNDTMQRARHARIIGLLEDQETHDFLVKHEIYGPDEPRQNVQIKFAHHVYTTTDDFPSQKCEPYSVFYGGGVGEGSSFDNWKAAMLCTLYDLFQVNDTLKDGDEFEVEYLGETAVFKCSGVHVIPA